MDDTEQIFALDPTAIRAGPGALGESGHDAQELGLSRVAVLSDKVVASAEPTDTLRRALSKSGINF